MSEQHLTEMPFSRLDLDPLLRRGIEEAGFRKCTPIQAESLPQALAGIDIAGQARTGTGKTAAFLLAAMNYLLRMPPRSHHQPGQPRVLILAPTRELAIQIFQDAKVLGKYTELRLGLVHGGSGYERQRQTLLAGVDVLIGTPGRTIDYFKQGAFRLKGVQVVVLDEADRMFDLGFIRDIRYLLRRMPPPEERLNMLYSATLSLRVTELAYEHMNNPVIVDASEGRITVDGVTQVLYHVPKEEKIPLLIGLLRHMDPTRTLVFTNTKREAARVAGYLESNGFHADLLSGDVPQRKRTRLFEQFKKGELPVLVATDVAARGLHIPDVSHVINYDLPQDREDYVHRIGRTARAGASGDAVSFACEEYVYSLMDIEEYIGGVIPTQPVTEELLAVPVPRKRIRPEREAHGRRPNRSRRPAGGRARSGPGKKRGKGGRDSGKNP